MASYSYELFADYFQFYLQDEQAEGIVSDAWTEEAVENLLATAPGTIGVGTVRNMDVPVTIEVCDTEPILDLAPWDHIMECDIDIPSGRLVVAGCTEAFPDAARITLEPGCYRARILYGALDSLSEDRLDGDDHYSVMLWKEASAGTRIIKRRSND